MRKGWDKDMEQEKLYVIEEKTYEAHIDEEVHLYGLLHQLAFLAGKIKDRRDMENLIDTARRYGEIADQIFQAGGCGDQPVDGGFQLCLVAGAVLYGLMLNVALALVPAGDDDGQAVLFAQAVAGPAYLMVAALVGVVVLVVGKADRIE